MAKNKKYQDNPPIELEEGQSLVEVSSGFPEMSSQTAPEEFPLAELPEKAEEEVEEKMTVAEQLQALVLKETRLIHELSCAKEGDVPSILHEMAEITKQRALLVQ